MEDKFSNRAVSSLLRSIATVYVLKDENRFRVVAYERAADAVDHLAREIKDIWQDKKLEEIPGVGKAISSHLDEYFRTGHSRHFDEILKKIPESIFVLMQIPTIGPKKAYKLVMNLNLFDKDTAVEDLKKACLRGKIAQMETFGEKSQSDILQAIGIYEKRSIKEERMILPYAFSIAEQIIDYLKQKPYFKRIDKLGSLRRMVETIGDVDLAAVVDVKYNQQAIDHFIAYPKTIKIDNAGDKKASIIVTPNVRVDLRIQEKNSYGSMLQYFTGSKNHNIRLREFALKKNYSLSEYGITKVESSLSVKATADEAKIKKFNSEERFYGYLGLRWIPPEIREGTDEIELAAKGQLPSLVDLRDIKGDLHVHSNFDLQPSHDLGEDSFEAMIKKAEDLGYQYVGFSEHNPKSSLLDKDVAAILKKRRLVIDKIKAKNPGLKIFSGLEVDILPNGHLALPEGCPDYLDYLIVSVHSAFDLDAEAMTNRVLEALKNPKVRILGHPTGRYFGKREGFALKWEKIFDFVKKNGIALEVNAWPERLDLPDLLVREAVNTGVKLIINTDAHAASHLNNMFYGVEVARRGWAQNKNIVNCLDASDFKNWLVG